MKTLISRTITAFLLIMSASAAVIAGPNPYRDCGIGAAIFPNTAWAAATSNATWDLGTTAVTSATSSPETCSSGNVETAQFIIDNYDNLVEETAKGQGEHLLTLLDIRGCGGQNQQHAIQAIRSDMGAHLSSKDYSDQNPVERAFNYYSVVTSATSTSCTS